MAWQYIFVSVLVLSGLRTSHFNWAAGSVGRFCLDTSVVGAGGDVAEAGDAEEACRKQSIT